MFFICIIITTYMPRKRKQNIFPSEQINIHMRFAKEWSVYNLTQSIFFKSFSVFPKGYGYSLKLGKITTMANKTNLETKKHCTEYIVLI